MHNAVSEFHPPLASADDFQKQSQTILHTVVCTHKVYWLVTNPLALLIFITCSGFIYGTLLLGINGTLFDAFAQAPNLEEASKLSSATGSFA
jgi:hypothetical protein